VVTARRQLTELIGQAPLVDHHVHGALRASPTRGGFESMINEGLPGEPPGSMTPFDSQLGFAIRRHCGPLLGVEPSAPAESYWQARAALTEAEVNRRLLPAAGVSDWIVDTGFGAGTVLSADELAQSGGGRGHEIVRLEALAEELAPTLPGGREYADAFRSRLAAALAPGRDGSGGGAVGVKSVIAYRAGFDIGWRRPAEDEVRQSADHWLAALAAAGAAPARLEDETLLRFGVYAALDAGRPLQLHVGFGDRDLDLRRANPLYLRDFLFDAEAADVPVMLLHCYPYEREAGYLAQSFRSVYLDVGLAVNYLGARSPAVIASSLELAPFGRLLYSSDAWGPAELHYLGAALWRRGMARVLGAWVDDGEWTAADAVRVAEAIGHGNARRVYGL
jgi:predicted TIM-barrel fold metal-dependent hydrolase